jgi:hypothetical protein
MAPTPQTYRNHFRLFPPYHLFAIPVLFVNYVNALRHIYLAPSLGTVWAAVVAAALFTLGLVTRTMALTVQDRVIRLEMRHRLKDYLPWDLQSRIPELTTPQLIALRFASDDEMPALVRDVLAGNLTTPKAIKQRVQNWQADYLRC